MHAALFAISRQGIEANAAAHDRLTLPFAILADTRADIFKATASIPSRPRRPSRCSCSMPAIASRACWSGWSQRRWREALAELRRLGAARTAVSLQAHPPVLVLPRMLSLEDCAFLAAVWRRDVPEYPTDGFTNPGTKQETGDFKVVHDGNYGRAVEYRAGRSLALYRRPPAPPPAAGAHGSVPGHRPAARRLPHRRLRGARRRLPNPHRDNSTPTKPTAASP